MRVVTPEEMARVEELAYAEGAQEEVFMEAAGNALADLVEEFIEEQELPHLVYLLCGKGNNSGDAYVAGRHLAEKGFCVEALQVGALVESGSLCSKMGERFRESNGKIKELYSLSDLGTPHAGVIVDGLFGTGFHGRAEGIYGALIEKANESGLPIIAIDIPSGLDGGSGEVAGPAIHAELTVYLGMAKRGFFLLDGPNQSGKLVGRNFGLEMTYIEQAEVSGELLEAAAVRPLLPEIIPTRHKYEAGHLLVIAGSPGMPGAAMLATAAALRMGCGMVRLMHPAGMEAELSSAPYEVIRHGYKNFDEIVPWLEKVSAVVIGPGMGRGKREAELLRFLMEAVTIPTLFDADALFLIAEHDIGPCKGSLLTPHLGEMHRLLKKESRGGLTAAFLEECQHYSDQYEVTVVLKGAATHIFHPGTLCHISNRGDPGMATAGSGDVLSGILAALLAQGLSPQKAAYLGCYLHGLSGEIGAGKFTSYSLIASDLIDTLPQAVDALLH